MWEEGEDKVEQDELKRYLEAGKPLKSISLSLL
jgi:hypothetical protein